MNRHVRTGTLAALALALAACAAPPDERAVDSAGDGAAGDAMASGSSSDATAADGGLSCFLRGATLEEAEGRTSPLRRLEFSWDGGDGLLCYGAPSARGREVMGGLVPYGEPWRAGANEPTTLHLSASASVGGVTVEPGSYSVYAIPGEDEWEFFLNSNYERWGIPISPDVRATEIGSFGVTPQPTDGMVEMLTYSYEDGAIVLEWENTRLEIPVGAPGT